VFRPSAYFYRLSLTCGQIDSDDSARIIEDRLIAEISAGGFVQVEPLPCFGWGTGQERLRNLKNVVERYYIQDKEGIYIPGQRIRKNRKSEFVIIADGYYRVSGNWEGGIVDGRPLAEDKVYLRRGTHILACSAGLEAPEPVVLRYDFRANKSA
jgi:hypothetical protein